MYFIDSTVIFHNEHKQSIVGVQIRIKSSHNTINEANVDVLDDFKKVTNQQMNSMDHRPSSRANTHSAFQKIHKLYKPKHSLLC